MNRREMENKKYLTQVLEAHGRVSENGAQIRICAGCDHTYEGTGSVDEIAEHQADVLWKVGVRP